MSIFQRLKIFKTFFFLKIHFKNELFEIPKSQFFFNSDLEIISFAAYVISKSTKDIGPNGYRPSLLFKMIL